jgi:chromosome partitioning protein
MEPKMLVTDAANTFDITIQAIHNKLKRKNLAYEKSKHRIYFGHTTAREAFEINFTKQTLSFQIIKGGTGKTTLCFSVGIRASLYGARVLFVDLDAQANLSKSCYVKAKDTPVMLEIISQDLPIESGILNVCDGVDILPSRMSNAMLDNHIMLNSLPIDRIYKTLLDQVKDKYDLILIDCPIGLGHSNFAAAMASDRIIAPVMPDEYSLEGLALTAMNINNMCKHYQRSIQISPVLNGYDSRTFTSQEVLSILSKSSEFGSVCKTLVRRSQEFPKAISKGTTIFDTLASNSAKDDIDDLVTKDILGIKGEK